MASEPLPLHVVGLHVENFKRIHAITITPDGLLNVIGGENGAGKSSALDAIAVALGGAELAPAEPIRTGETEAKIVVKIGEKYIVTRRFYRDRLPCDCGVVLSPDDIPIIGDDEAHLNTCASKTKFGPTKSVLTITNADGARYPSPQKLLDDILGDLTFDPLAFVTADQRKQYDILKDIVNLDTSAIDQKITNLLEDRRMGKAKVADLEARLSTIVFHVDAPAEPIPATEVTQALLDAEQKRDAVKHHETKVTASDGRLKAFVLTISDYASNILQLERQLADCRVKLAEQETLKKEETIILAAAMEKLNEAKAAVPDTAALQKQILEIEETNKKVESNARHNSVKTALARERDDLTTVEKTLGDVRMDRQKMLTSLKFPIAGLSFSDEQRPIVLFNELPLEQASTADQIRISAAISTALNPTLRVMFIKQGNLLDSKSLALLVEHARASGTQIWMEKVSEDGKGVTVMIADGEVVA